MMVYSHQFPEGGKMNQQEHLIKMYQKQVAQYIQMKAVHVYYPNEGYQSPSVTHLSSRIHVR